MAANCPYCEKETEIIHDDGYGYREDEMFQQECAHCEKTFSYTTIITFHYRLFRAPCLNGSRHNRKRSITYPPQHARWVCIYCGDEKPLTPAQFEQAKEGYKNAD